MAAILRFFWFPTAVVLITCAWIWLDSAMGWRGIQLRGAGAALVTAGALVGVWCAAILFARGKGTPHPFTAKTTRLVVDGPYAHVRNPMMWGVGMVLAGLALLLGSAGLWMGFATFLVWIALFVRRYEERDMERRFGEEYRAYCRRVPRWWPRLRA